jgi:hypothetical protein
MSFNASKIYEVKIISGGLKSCKLRYPSDPQWIERARSQKTVRNFLGRGKSTTTVQTADDADLRLFKQLVVNEADREAYAGADATAFIERLDRAEVTEGVWEGDTRRIVMKVPGAVVTHILRIPTQAEMRPHERSSAQAVYANRSAEIRISLLPSAELYDKIKREVAGYDGPVPINHKVAAINNLVEALPSLIEEEEEAVPEDEGPAAAGGQTSRASAS